VNLSQKTRTPGRWAAARDPEVWPLRSQAVFEDRANQAADFSFVTDKILQEQCRAAGVSSDQVRPMLNRAEIAELRDFADRMYPASRIRQEFTDAARQAERGLQEREAAEAARQAEQALTLSILPKKSHRILVERTLIRGG
jgi:predicted HAD superfamily Cof-like phosphohydrolase